MDFTAQALRRSVDNPSEELTVSFTEAYNNTLKEYHNFIVKKVFAVAMKACPYRKDFYQKLDVVTDAALEQMKQWLAALENIITIIQGVLNANPAVIKGL